MGHDVAADTYSLSRLKAFAPEELGLGYPAESSHGKTTGAAMTVDSRTTSNTDYTGVALALSCVGLYVAFHILSRYAALERIGVPEMIALRLGVAAVVLAPLLFVTKRPPIKFHRAVVLSIFGGLGFSVLAYSGLALSPASHGGVLMHGTLPLFAMIVGWALAGERFSFRKRWGGGLIVAGVVTIAAAGSVTVSMRNAFGDALLLSASLSWTLFGAFIRRYGIGAVVAAAVATTLAAAIYFPIYFLIYWDPNILDRVAVSQLVLQGIFQGVFIGAVSPIAYTATVERLGLSGTAFWMAAVPVLTTIASVTLLGEELTAPLLLGVGLATLGLYLALLKPRSR